MTQWQGAIRYYPKDRLVGPHEWTVGPGDLYIDRAGFYVWWPYTDYRGIRYWSAYGPFRTEVTAKRKRDALLAAEAGRGARARKGVGRGMRAVAARGHRDSAPLTAARWRRLDADHYTWQSAHAPSAFYSITVHRDAAGKPTRYIASGGEARLHGWSKTFKGAAEKVRADHDARWHGKRSPLAGARLGLRAPKRPPKAMLDKAVKAMRLYHGGQGHVRVRDHERLYSAAYKGVIRVADAAGIDYLNAWNQIEDKARSEGPLRPSPGKDY